MPISGAALAWLEVTLSYTETAGNTRDAGIFQGLQLFRGRLVTLGALGQRRQLGHVKVWRDQEQLGCGTVTLVHHLPPRLAAAWPDEPRALNAETWDTGLLQLE